MKYKEIAEWLRNQSKWYRELVGMTVQPCTQELNIKRAELWEDRAKQVEQMEDDCNELLLIAYMGGVEKSKPRWKPIETAPKDKPILAWCEKECTDSECNYCKDHDEYSKFGLCLYHAHAEDMSSLPTGLAIVCWGGSFDDSTWEYPNQANLPDWWFEANSDFEVAANPTHWMPLPSPPEKL